MVSLARAGFAVAVLAALSGCATSSGQTPPAAAAAAVVAAPYLGLANGSLGQNLDAADKTAANKAELAALSSGDRKTWRGDDGSYGYVAPAAGAGGLPRLHPHRLYQRPSGRRQRHGLPRGRQLEAERLIFRL